MKKFTVNKEDKGTEPTREQIDRHKDFSKFSHEYDKYVKRPKKPIYKDPKLFLLLILLLILTIVLLMEGK